MVSGSVAISYRWSFLLLKDVIAIFRLDMKRYFKACIMVASLSERNILHTSFVSSVVYYMTAAFANNIENMALICRSIS